MSDLQREKVWVAWLSVASNSVLVVGKVIVGLLIGSVSVISEAIHSGMDLLASVMALFAVNTSHKPADDDHQFGHGKIESISGAVEALLIFAAAGWIIYEAFHRLLHPKDMRLEVGWGVVVMAVSAGLNMIVSHKLFAIGKKSDSLALQADAWHLRTDVYTSVGVMVSLAIIWTAGRFFPGKDFTWIDPLAAIAVALLILRAAYDLTVQAVRDLLDERLPAEDIAWIGDHIARLRPTVRGYHRLRTRKSGANRFVDFHLLVEPSMSVEESHRIAEEMTREIEERFPASNVTVHIEPCDGSCSPHCLSGCLLTEEERESVRVGT